MPTRSLAIIDHASGVSGRDLQRFADALERQLAEEVAPHWGRYVGPFIAKSTAELDPKTWRLNLWKSPRDARDAGALGYHETFGKDCTPVGHVFTELAEKEGSWTTIADHEALEMVGDEWVNMEVARVLPDGSVELWPRELCDACQGLTYMRKGVELSDFLLPEYFIEGSDGPYDFLGKLDGPFTIDETGYSTIRTIRNGKVKTKDFYGPRYAPWRREPRTLSRKASRFRW